jgi:hypothetical protein
VNRSLTTLDRSDTDRVSMPLSEVQEHSIAARRLESDPGAARTAFTALHERAEREQVSLRERPA